MFIGHFAVGLASKRVAPRTSGAWLLLAPLFLDTLWPIFLALGVEHVRIAPGDTAFTPLDFTDYPWSHSLAMTLVWSALFGGVYLAATGYRRGAAVLAASVLSHWVLDWITHRPDLPLWPGGAVRVGLGLWSSVAGTVIVEVAMFAAALWLYATGTRAVRRGATAGLWIFAGVLGLMYLSDLFAPPPPSVAALEIVAMVMYLVVPAFAWIDRGRELVGPP